MSETTCAASAILPNLTSAAVDGKVAQLPPSVDRLFRGPQNTLTCDVTLLLHLSVHLSYSLFSDVNKLRFHKYMSSASNHGGPGFDPWPTHVVF